MNVTEAIAWQTVASLLRGELDHGDDATRADIARSCARLDQRARAALMAGAADSPSAWDDHLCRVMTDPA